jgi:hypothetical protein
MPNFSDITSYISNPKPYIEMLNKLYYMSSREVSDVYGILLQQIDENLEFKLHIIKHQLHHTPVGLKCHVR